MARWLLSGHNPQETFGISYPLTLTFSTEFAARRQLGDFVTALAGGTGELDLTINAVLAVQSRVYLNMNYFVRNFGVVMPFDVSSFGAPKGMVKSERKPRLQTRLRLPFRLWAVYRQTVKTYREVVPLYREWLEEIYWRLRGSLRQRLTGLESAALDQLFSPALFDQASAFVAAYAAVAMLNSTVSTVVQQRAPALLNLLVGEGSSTARLADYMWELRQVAEACGPETTALLRRGETDLDAYHRVPAARPLLEALDYFLLAYGHRAFRYASEFEATRLADQPQMILLAIGGLLDEEEPPAVRAAAARRIGRQALRKMNPLRRAFWSQILRLGRALVERREENRDTLELQNATFGLAARVLSGQHFPDQPADTLWLYTFDELLAFGRSRGKTRVDSALIRRRRAELERHRQAVSPPELIWYDSLNQQWWPAREPAGEPPAGQRLVLRGIGASAGSGPVEGIALVTGSAEEAAQRLLRVSGPVVLVTHVTDPVWSSLFRRVTAVVTEMGGAISHAAVVARENGVPAVVGVADATRAIRDGQLLRVDGAAGVVELIG